MKYFSLTLINIICLDRKEKKGYNFNKIKCEKSDLIEREENSR